MSLETLRSEVSTVQYKPGWNITVDTDGGWGPVIRIRALVIDSNPPHGAIVIDHVQPIPDPYTDASLARFSRWIQRSDYCRVFVKECISRVEGHELGEWLRFGDERPFMPHHGDEGNPYEQEV